MAILLSTHNVSICGEIRSVFLWRPIFSGVLCWLQQKDTAISLCVQKRCHFITSVFFFFFFFIYLFFIIDLIVAFIQNSYTHGILFDYFLFNVKFIPSWIYVTLRVYFAKCIFFIFFIYLFYFIFFVKDKFSVGQILCIFVVFFFLFFFIILPSR